MASIVKNGWVAHWRKKEHQNECPLLLLPGHRRVVLLLYVGGHRGEEGGASYAAGVQFLQLPCEDWLDDVNGLPSVVGDAIDVHYEEKCTIMQLLQDFFKKA